jgi:thioredoxin 1
MNNFETLIYGNKPVVVDFFAEWCGPCKMMPTILKEVKQHVGEMATIIKMDVDKNQFYSNRFNIQSIPTLIIFKQGNILWRKSGVASANEIIQQLAIHVNE